MKKVKKNGIFVNPLSISLNNKSYREYEDISTEQLLEYIDEGFIPKTSQPSLFNLVEIYKENEKDEILYISVADGLSGAYNSGLTGKAMIGNPENIHIINTKTLCGPHRYLVDLAKRLVDEGKKIDEIKSILEEKINSSKSFLIPMDFDFLERGGRLSPLVSKLATTIKLVPVMTLDNDCKKIVRYSTSRTIAKAFTQIIKQFEVYNVDDSYKIYISHAMARKEYLEELLNILKITFPNTEIETNVLSPVFVTHGGPGCIAVQIIKK